MLQHDGPQDTFEYIPGHKGHFANELADRLSKHGALHGPDPGARDTLMKWLAHAILPPASGNPECRTPDHAGLSPSEIIAPFVPIGVLGDSVPDRPAEEQQLLELRVLSFNTLSLGAAQDKELELGEGLTSGPARAALLADQLKAHQVIAAALQETRSEAGSTRVGGFLRYAAGSERGQFGTEWWFLDGAPLTKTADSDRQYRFEAQALTTVFADCRRMFIRYSRPGMHILFVSLHAPHRATEHHILEEWWRTTLNLVFQHRRNDWLIVAGDFNCALGSIGSWLLRKRTCQAPLFTECSEQLTAGLRLLLRIAMLVVTPHTCKSVMGEGVELTLSVCLAPGPRRRWRLRSCLRLMPRMPRLTTRR